MINASVPVGMTKANGSVTAYTIVSSESWYMMSVPVDSVAVMPRTPTTTVPNRIALPSANSAPT